MRRDVIHVPVRLVVIKKLLQCVCVDLMRPPTVREALASLGQVFHLVRVFEVHSLDIS